MASVLGSAEELAAARAFIAQQLAHVASGDVLALRATFTERLQDMVTAELVARVREDAAKLVLEELVDAVARLGTGALKVRMKNERMLTTLVPLGNGSAGWVADTLWLK